MKKCKIDWFYGMIPFPSENSGRSSVTSRSPSIRFRTGSMVSRTAVFPAAWLFLVLWLLQPAVGSPALTEAGNAPSEAEQVVDTLHGALLAAMQEGARLGFKGRYEALEPVIRSTFDLPLVARITVGRYWDDFTDGQKTAMVERFSKLSVSTYASRFDNFSGESFKLVSEKPLKEGQVLVKSTLKKSNGETVRLDYVLLHADGHWRIINVIADGVSDISLKRGQYTSIIRRKGFDALIVKINEKIEGYENGQSD
jgi:phospholipid transport system substrate-binding protein